MKRTKPVSATFTPASAPPDVQRARATLARIQVLTSLLRRSDLYSGLGKSYGGDRDLYEALGYPTTLSYADYLDIYGREGVPKRVNNFPCDSVWQSPPRVFDVGDTEPSPFETAWAELVERLGVFSRFCRADKLLGFGDYSIIVLGFDDAKNVRELEQPVRNGAKLLYMQCYAAEFAPINKVVGNLQDARYALPELYQIRQSTVSSVVGSDASSAVITTATDSLVHWSRVIHIVEGNLSNEVYGEPRLKVCFNRLKDIEKILGGSAEMFWRGARPGHVASLDPEAQWDEDDPSLTEMKEQLDEYEHNLRRFLFLQGVDLKAIDTQVADPSKHLDVQLQDISAATGIPKRVLIGAEQGELASSQDRSNWEDQVAARRENWATPVVIRPFIDRLIEYKVIPVPADGKYQAVWPDQRAPSDREKAEVGKTRAEALKTYADSAGSSSIVPIANFLRICMGLDEESIQEIQEAYEEMAVEEEADMASPAPEEAVVEEPVVEEVEEPVVEEEVV